MLLSVVEKRSLVSYRTWYSILRDIVRIEGNRFIITPHPSLTDRYLILPGANKKRSGDISLPLNLISWYILHDLDFPSWSQEAISWYDQEDEIIQFGAQVNHVSLDTWAMPDMWEWQAQAVERVVRYGSVALFDDRGMGKTRVVIEAIRTVDKPAVVVTSKRLRNVWSVASGLWWGPDKAIAPTAQTWSAAADQIGQAPITIVTYESLYNEDVHSAICELEPHFLVLEESHNLKKRHRQNKRTEIDEKGKEVVIKTDTKSGLARGLPGEVRIAVSGTPAPNVWHEIWTPLNFVAPDVFTSFWQFVEGIGDVTVNFWGGKEIDIEMYRTDIWDQIYDRWMILRDRSIDRRTIWDFVSVELSSKESKAYRQMQEEMRVEMEGQELDAPNVLAQAVRLQQLAGAYGKWETYHDEEGKKKSSFLHADPSSKTDELILRLAGLNRSVVFTRFRNRAEFVAKRIREELDMEVLLMVGGISEAKQSEMLDRFFDLVHNPDPLVAICVYGTISEGVNELVTARDIFLLDWYTSKDAVQAVDRLDRPGIKHESVRATVLYSEGTIDELMIDRSALRVLPLKEVLRTPDAYAFLLNPIDRQIEE